MTENANQPTISADYADYVRQTATQIERDNPADPAMMEHAAKLEGAMAAGAMMPRLVMAMRIFGGSSHERTVHSPRATEIQNAERECRMEKATRLCDSRFYILHSRSAF